MVTDSRHSSVRKVPLSTYGPVYTREIGPLEIVGLDIKDDYSLRTNEAGWDTMLRLRASIGVGAVEISEVIDRCNDEGNFSWEGYGASIASVAYGSRGERSRSEVTEIMPWDNYQSMGRPEKIMIERTDVFRSYSGE